MNPPIPASLRRVVRPSVNDARYVPMSPMAGYQFSPQLPQREQLDFATRRQCNDLITMIKTIAPGAELAIVDTGENRVYPPYMQLKYFNKNGLDDPRIFEITGTIPTDQGPQQTIIEVGYFLQVMLLMENPRATTLSLVIELGGIFPHWV
jgi:hypothetical protein